LAAGQKLIDVDSSYQHFFSQLHNRDGLFLPYGKFGFRLGGIKPSTSVPGNLLLCSVSYDQCFAGLWLKSSLRLCFNFIKGDSPMKKISLTGWILIAVFVGVLSGWLFHDTFVIDVAAFLATVFTRLLKMLIVPLIFTSIVSGIIGVGSATNLGKMGGKTLLYYICTSFMAILTGLVLVNVIQPGVGADLGLKEAVTMNAGNAGSLVDVFIRMIPANAVKAASDGQMLPIIVFCVFLGIGITQLPKGNLRTSLENLFNAGFQVMMKVTHIVLLFAPIGIWGYLTKLVGTTGFDAFIPLGWYALTVFMALVIHAFITLPLILRFMARYNPMHFFKHMGAALLTAFSTASSSATLPLTLECVEKNAKVSNKVSSFVLPLGATINMDGTALYECVAVMFIAQAYGVELSFVSQMVVVITALLASIGAAGIPMAGLVMMSIVLTAVGLPLEGVGLIIAVDRVLDMCRTTVNVWSDSCGTMVIGKLEGEVGIQS